MATDYNTLDGMFDGKTTAEIERSLRAHRGALTKLTCYIETAVNAAMGYSHLSDTEAPIIPSNSKAPEILTVFWLGSYLSDSQKGP